MSCKSLLALPLLGALVLFVTGSAWANHCPPPAPVSRPACSPTPICPPACSAVPACASVCPGELPELQPSPIRHTLTIFNGAHVVQQNFIQRQGAWQNCGPFQDYDIFFRDSPRVPWRYYGTYYSARSAADAAGILRANGNLASVRPHCA
jgi:hypothetical protein